MSWGGAFEDLNLVAKHEVLEPKYGVRLQACPDPVEPPSEYLDHAGEINGSGPRRQQICGNQGFRESQPSALRPLAIATLERPAANSVKIRTGGIYRR